MSDQQEVPAEAVAAAAQVLRDEGGEPGNSIHSWRCEYPDRYGECDCVNEIARSMLAAAAPALVQAGREAAAADIMSSPHPEGPRAYFAGIARGAGQDTPEGGDRG